MYKILIVDDNPVECQLLAGLLYPEWSNVQTATDGKTANERLKEGSFNLVITSVRLPEVSGFNLLRQIKERDPEISVILVTDHGRVQDAVTAIKLGAADYIVKPFDEDTFISIVKREFEKQRLKNGRLRKRTDTRFDGVMSRDREIRRIMELTMVLARSNVTVLITGESGTGKSLFAKAIHYNSARRDKPYIEVPCGAIPETLLESELFGYSRGSFTGAVEDKTGIFERADGGTILLDEIYSAPPSFQIKLLRVLQDKKFEKVGGINTIKSDVRVIVATHSDLRNEVIKGNFRKDLYYRINVMPLNIPPLRERQCDIKPLVEYFVYKYCGEYKKEKLLVTDEALYKLQKYRWPGNVRELENVIQQAVISTRGSYISLDGLPFEEEDEYVPDIEGIGEFPLKKAMEKPEKKFIERTLRYYNGNRNKTAELLRLNRTTLYKKIKKYNLA